MGGFRSGSNSGSKVERKSMNRFHDEDIPMPRKEKDADKFGDEEISYEARLKNSIETMEEMKNFRQHIIRKGERIICWFSCGAASAWATKMTIVIFGLDHPVIPVYCDTSKSEHPDNARFIKDCEKWFGCEILKLSNKEFPTGTVEEVFDKRKYMSGVPSAVCTTQMKKVPRFEFSNPDDINVFGFTSDEGRRIAKFENTNPDMNLLWILRDHNQTKKSCYEALIKAGIELPEMYKLGYKNNNCLGCVKATSPSYWQKVRQDFPDVFEKRAIQSRLIGCRLVRVDGKRIFLDEMPTDRNFPFELEDISCGPECGSANDKSNKTHEPK